MTSCVNNMEAQRPYQIITTEFMRNNPKCACTNAAGLGKTRCTIDSWADDDIVLVVCPAHLRPNWEKEILKWRPEILPQCTIRSYHYFALLKGKTILPKFTAAVVDESTYIKAWTAKRTLVLCRLILPQIPRVCFLSASPIQKSAMDIHPTLTILQPGEWGEEEEFGERFCNRMYDHYKGMVYSGVNQENAAELRERWRKVSIKFTKQDVAKELPPIVEDIVILESAKTPDYDPATVDYEHMTEATKTEYQRIGMEKVPFIMDFIETAAMEPTLIFTHHRRVNEELTAALRKAGQPVGQILGGSKGTYKQELVDQFQDGFLNYLVISLEAGSTGLNLPRATRVLFAEQPWTYTTYYQALNRAHRLTSKNTLYVHNFILKATLDEGLYRVRESKKGFSDAIVGELDQTTKKGKDHDSKNKHESADKNGEGASGVRDASEAESAAHSGNISNSKRASSTKQPAKKRSSGESARPKAGSGGRERSGGRSSPGKSEGAASSASSNLASTANTRLGRHSGSADDLGLGLVSKDDLGLGINTAQCSSSRERLYSSGEGGGTFIDSEGRTYEFAGNGNYRENSTEGSSGKEEPLGQGPRSSSTECGSFLDELCRATVPVERLSEEF